MREAVITSGYVIAAMWFVSAVVVIGIAPFALVVWAVTQ